MKGGISITYLIYKVDSETPQGRTVEQLLVEKKTMREVMEYLEVEYARPNFIRHLKTYNGIYKGYEIIKIDY